MTKRYLPIIYLLCLTIVVFGINMVWKIPPVYSYATCVFAWIAFFLVMIMQFPKEKAKREPRHYLGICASSLGLLLVVLDIFRHLMR